MSEFQTSVQVEDAIQRGGCKIELAPVAASPSWVDIGALQGCKLEPNEEINAEENDNTDSTDQITKMEYMLSGTMMEGLRDDIRQIIRGSSETRTTTAGTLVTGATQTLVSGAWAYKRFYKIENQNGDAFEISITSVTGSVDGVLTEENGYFKGRDPQGNWGIFMADDTSELSTAVQNIVIVYNYTPLASVTYSGGDKTDISHFMARITVKNDGNPWYWIGLYGNTKKGIGREFKKDSDTDRRNGVPFEFVFRTLPAGQGASANEGLVYIENATGTLSL